LVFGFGFVFLPWLTLLQEIILAIFTKIGKGREALSVD
jgi:hypothetical protein